MSPRSEGATSSRRAGRRVSFGSLGLFALLWLLVGYSLGTGTLLGPVRWLTGFTRGQGLAEWVENAGVAALVLLLVAASALVALWLTGVVRRSPRWDVKLGIPLLAGLAAGGALWLWLQPGLVVGDAAVESPAGSRFSYGPYPDEERMRSLKSQGYTAIVSLLHPAVVPFEPLLLADEKEAAERVGIELVHLPMLPWVSENLDALRAVREIAEDGDGRYYVHCYLGKDRVNVFRRVAGDPELPAARRAAPSARQLKHGLELERGPLVRLEEGVYVMGFPSDEEFFAYIVGAGVKQVVSLLDPGAPRNGQWIERERRMLAPYGVPVAQVPLSDARPDCGEIRAAVARVREMPRPVVVHQFLSPATGRAPMASAFVEEYVRTLPPAPRRRELLERSVPRLQTVITLGPVLLLLVSLAAAWVGWLRVGDEVWSRSTRNLFHGLTFTFAAGLALAGGLQAVTLLAAVLAGVLLYAAHRGPGFPLYEALAPSRVRWAGARVVVVPLILAVLGGAAGALLAAALAPAEDERVVVEPRRLRHGLALERGAVVELEDGVFLTGYPTRKEHLRYFSNGGVRHVVSLTDAGSAEDRERNEEERRFLASCGVDFTIVPLTGDRDEIRAAAERVAGLPRPVVVHDFLSPSTGRAPTANAFAEEYRNLLPPFYLRFLERALPTPREVATLGPLLLLAIVLAAAWVGWLRVERGVAAPYTRKAFHFVIFTLAGALHLAGGLPWVMLLGVLTAAAVLFAVWRGDGFPFYEAMARPTDRPHRTLFILVPLAATALGGVASNLLFAGFAHVGYVVSGWGDAVAEPVGTRWGKHPYRVPSLAGVPARRTWEGSAAVLGVGALGAAVALAASGTDPVTALWVGLVCGAAAAAVEAVSNHGTDNFTLQVAASGVAYLLLS